jgi:Rrf2 family protein
MLVTQKNQYALRAIFELAKYMGQGPIKIYEIAEAQNIPLRFLEVILSRLKRSGLVESKRGYTGGYTLIRDPMEITVADIFRFMDESLGPIECVACVSEKSTCPYQGQCAFFPMWQKVQDAIRDVFDKTTIHDLLEVNNSEGVHCCM